MVALALVLGTSGCITHRPALLLVEHQTRAAPATGLDKKLHLKLVTYNVWGLPSWMTGAREGRYPKIARELERLNPDIILLQEAWTAKARKAGPSNGHWASARAAGQHTFFQQSGLVTLSRFPVLGGEFYPFSRAAFPDRLVNKGVLKVSVLLPDRRVLNLWNVHLQEGGSDALRRSQIRELLSRVDAAEDGQAADLVGGDFNCTPDSLLYRQLAKSLGRSVQPFDRAAPFVTWDGMSAKPRAGQTLDYVFIRLRATLQKTGANTRVAFAAPKLNQRLSDHLGIEALMSLSPVPVLADAAAHSLETAPVPQMNPARISYVGNSRSHPEVQ